MIIYLDIETLPTSDAGLIAELEASIKPPAQYKKAETIQQWMDENKQAELAALVSKTALNGLYGSIACICYAINDSAVRGVSLLDGDEAHMLRLFFTDIGNVVRLAYHGGETYTQPVFCGHNIAGFDLPFIKHRAIINNVAPPAAMLKAVGAKPWESCIADTMLMWSPDRERRVSMDKLCRALGIKGKGDMDGSKVAETWQSDPQKVIDYCMGDVERTRQMYQRLTFNQVSALREAA